MKKSHLSILICLLLATPALSQDRPRFFDNFDTSHGVQVVKPAYIQTSAKGGPSASSVTYATPSGSTKLVNGKRYLMPTGMSAPVNASKAKQNTRSSNMNVYEGLAEREGTSYGTRSSAMSMGTNNGMKGFTTGNPEHDSYIVDSSRRYGIDPLLIYAQMHQESSFKLKATSNKGASGLMQLMPATARRLGVSNIYDPKQNIEGGVKYMRMLLDMFGQDVNLALAGYNAGEGAVMKYGNNIPPYNETREYVRRISARYSSISNPALASTMPRVNNRTAAQLAKNEAPPLTIQQNAMAVKLPDGRMRLVN
ncbi:MAG TPA: lytic transglycosylase domain-containing protein [Pyrinomonadaceae bacterium]|nr:lytic transglycosylase domain-containing protein [Acidobacteriota bacterium]HQZ98106.1 lytic transglycosylase domain-containing protein [Pyrinomonadaceae bacterium]